MADTPLQHNVIKLADLGLQLRLPVDLVPMTQYSRLNNVIPVIEGQLETRPGLTLVFAFPRIGLELNLADSESANWADALSTNTLGLLTLTVSDNNSGNWADAIATVLAP